MTEPDKDVRIQDALHDPEVQRLIREDPELAEYADRLPPADEPRWEISDEELMKKSPAAVAVRKMLSSRDPETDIQALFGQAQEMVDSGPDPAFPDRPDHPDFHRLSRIIQDMDITAEKDGFGAVIIPVELDGDSIGYMARQRVARAQMLLSESNMYQQMAILWIDAFTAGVKFAQEKAPTITQLLDRSIDGNHRSGRIHG